MKSLTMLQSRKYKKRGDRERLGCKNSIQKILTNSWEKQTIGAQTLIEIKIKKLWTNRPQSSQRMKHRKNLKALKQRGDKY